MTTEKKKLSLYDRIKGWSKDLCLALFLVFFFNTFLVQAYYVPSSSMENNLLPQDRLFASKLSYGYNFRNPLTLENYHFFKSRPELYDVVIFRNPLDAKKMFVKRVLGRHGDTIEIKGGKLFINNKPARADFLKESRMLDIPALSDYHNLQKGLLALPLSEFKEEIKNKYPHLLLQFQNDYHRIALHLQKKYQVLKEKLASGRISEYNWGPIYVPGKGDKILQRKLSEIEYEFLVKYFRNVWKKKIIK
ncbi:signal peptidase I [Candidatus Riflebacteria bacterium]